MPLVLADRVRETTTTTGTGTIFLAGPVSGFQGFNAAIGNGNTTYYTIVEAATGAWEVGIGTYTSAGSLLSRDTVLSSSNSGSLVPFGVGTKDVFVTQPAERAVYVLGAGTGLAAGAAAFTANGVVYASGTDTLTTGSALTFTGSVLGVNNSGDSDFKLTTSNTGSGSTDGLLLRINSTGTEAYLWNWENGALIFGTNATEQMRLTSTGLGIGTSSPDAKLDVLGSSSDQIRVRTAETEFYRFGRNSSTGFLDFYGSQTGYQGYTFGGVDGTWATINSLGNLGIGTSLPLAKLHVNQSSVSTGLLVYVNATGTTNVVNFQAYDNLLGVVSRMVVQANGNVGIGTSSPATKLEVSGSAAVARVSGTAGTVPQLSLSSAGVVNWTLRSNNDAASDFTIYQDSTQRLKIDSSGNLGIGTSSPGYKLDVQSAGTTVIRSYASAGNLAYVSVAGNAGVPGTSSFDIIQDGSSNTFLYNRSNTYMAFGTNNTERARIDSSGNFSMAAAGAITSSRINPRTSTTASTATLTPDIQAADQYNLTAQAVGLTVAAPIGTPVDGNKLMFRILDNGSAQTIAWDATYTAIGVTLPTATTANKMVYVGCVYNSTNTRWDVVAVTTQA